MFRIGMADGKERFGVIDIGLNPDLVIPEGSAFRSWVVEGMLTVGVGGNLWAGGSNPIGFAINGHIVAATVEVDGTTIVEDGRLVL